MAYEINRKLLQKSVRKWYLNIFFNVEISKFKFIRILLVFILYSKKIHPLIPFKKNIIIYIN